MISGGDNLALETRAGVSAGKIRERRMYMYPHAQNYHVEKKNKSYCD